MAWGAVNYRHYHLFVVIIFLLLLLGHKLNVHKTFRRRPERLLNFLCTFNLRPKSTGKWNSWWINWTSIVAKTIINVAFTVSIYLFRVSNGNIRTICSKLTIKTPDRGEWRCSQVSAGWVVIKLEKVTYFFNINVLWPFPSRAFLKVVLK